MHRSIIYAVCLVACLGATVFTMFSIFHSNWLSWDVSTPMGHITKTISLHTSCSTIDGFKTCHHFPQKEDCNTEDRYFCSMWRSVEFMMSFAAVLECVTVVAYVVVIAGGKQKRENGWKVLAGLLVLVGALGCASMSIVAYLFDNDERFFAGWALDNGWKLCTASWSIAIVSAAVISLSALVSPEEGGYELIPSERTGL